MKHDIRLLLDNIRSVHNVGSIFRTAETLGISKIYCVGTTPTPLDRFNRKRKDFAKVALGAEESVKWEHVPDAVVFIKSLKKAKKHEVKRKNRRSNNGRNNWTIVALEQAKGSIDYKKVKIKSKTLIIIGNEVEGVSQSVLKLSDVIAEIPLKGKKESLNVSVAAGIFLYRLLDK